MKKPLNLRILTLILVLFTASGLQAQLSLQLGANINNARFKFENVDQTPSLNSFTHINAGLHYTIGTGNFQIIPGLLYSVKGFDQRNQPKFIFRYIELPVLGAYTLELFEGFRVQANAGLFLGYMLGGQVNPPNSNDPIELDFEKDYNRMDMGYQYGLGVLYNKIKFGLQFSGGLIDISKRNNWDVKTRVTAINLGYYLW